MSTATLNLTPELYTYLQKVSLREPEVLKKLREETQQQKMSIMQISPEQGQFMGLLAELLGAKKTLDIGTFTGYSALVVALALPPEGRVIACDINVEWADIAKRYWHEAKVAEKIDLRLAPALTTLDQLIANGENGTFDFAFIDADKANYTAYYERAISLLRSGGLIAVDNVLWGGSVADEADQEPSTIAIRLLNMHLFQDNRVTISMLPVGDGLTLARKR
ncbi:MAG: SAM-dependent methyltransferase [Gammaproteobacteria bacterium RIFCSPHIGHO2_12_FULL_42_13]|nr:MAG: SAM-dependent methyltransferase [Gammaproteobacteria bacterium RIFCSPHIGHO2_12_FULL_42_13]